VGCNGRKTKNIIIIIIIIIIAIINIIILSANVFVH